MESIYNKYVIYVNIKKLKAYKLKFNNVFTLYYHKLYDDDWSLDSYKQICSFDNIANFWILYNNHICLNNGMYFLMKDNIKPIYEDKKNIKGGYWSLKILGKNINKLWLNIVLDFVGNNLSSKNIINGLSIVFKKKFYIIKIWIKNKKYNDIKYLNIDKSYKNNIFYNNFIN